LLLWLNKTAARQTAGQTTATKMEGVDFNHDRMATPDRNRHVLSLDKKSSVRSALCHRARLLGQRRLRCRAPEAKLDVTNYRCGLLAFLCRCDLSAIDADDLVALPDL